MRKKQERVRLWKEKKLAEEAAKKKLAIAAAEKEAEELKLKQLEASKKKEQEEKEAAEKQAQVEEEPQLLQQFAAMRKAAAEAAEKEEEEKAEEPKPEIMQVVEEEDNSGKKWSLEDDSDEDDMDIDGSDEAAEAERTFNFKPLVKNDDDSKEDSILVKPKKTFLMSNKSTKPTMRMGFGLGKPMMKKAVVTKKEVESKPEPVQDIVDTVMEDSDDIDPLEAYMMDVHAETKKINEEDKIRMDKLNQPSKRRGSLMEDDDNDGVEETKKLDDEDEVGSDPEDILA
jgi:ATP-dependent RNA helicase DDX46/PRP5